ncbi:MAG TPA: type II toxin-antitoxin system HigB family toxin [Bryobacteraceae bacterium]|nr:type II toxin-antitoxin system HigB family toxin [Bryobacteraceae bacterium]
MDAWYRVAKSATWKNLEEVRGVYPHADGVPAEEKVFTIFNVMGNSFRLVTGINYEGQTIFIKHVLTHAEYDKGDWKK